jgi:hypothetical protein
VKLSRNKKAQQYPKNLALFINPVLLCPSF